MWDLKEVCTSKLHQKQPCTSSDHQQHICQVWSQSDARFLHCVRYRHTYRHTDMQTNFLLLWKDYPILKVCLMRHNLCHLYKPFILTSLSNKEELHSAFHRQLHTETFRIVLHVPGKLARLIIVDSCKWLQASHIFFSASHVFWVLLSFDMYVCCHSWYVAKQVKHDRKQATVCLSGWSLQNLIHHNISTSFTLCSDTGKCLWLVSSCCGFRLFVWWQMHTVHNDVEDEQQRRWVDVYSLLWHSVRHRFL